MNQNQSLPNFDLWQKGYRLLMAIYRLVNIFPRERKHSIGSELKESANGALAKIACSKFDLAHDKILETLSNLEVARGLGLAKSVNFQILSREYQKLTEELKKHEHMGGSTSHIEHGRSNLPYRKDDVHPHKLNPRQKKIVQYLKNNDKINFSQISQIFSEISPRTARLDLKDLLAKELIHKNGKSVKTYYTLFTPLFHPAYFPKGGVKK